MAPERERIVARELASWTSAHGSAADETAIAAERSKLEDAHQTFPFAWLLGLCAGICAVVGARRSRLGEPVVLPLGVAAVVAAASIGGVILLSSRDVSLLGGALRPNDPRRFLIEAMVGAMTADGVISPSEQTVMERTIAHHALFAGLGAAAAHTLIDLSMDAIRFAGGSVERVQAIAKGLPARIHRIAAYGMAAEIAVADQVLEASELGYLEALRLALRISPLEAESIIAAAQAGEIEPFVADRYLRIQSMISVAAEVFALRALAGGKATDEQRFEVRELFAAIPDLALSPRRSRHRAVSRVPPAARARCAGVRRAVARRAVAARSGRSLLDGRVRARRGDAGDGAELARDPIRRRDASGFSDRRHGHGAGGRRRLDISRGDASAVVMRHRAAERA